MSKIKGLEKKQFFLHILSDYLNNGFSIKEKRLLKLYQSILHCPECKNAEKKELFFPYLNPEPNIFIILDPYFLYSTFQETDKEAINELFTNILKAMDISSDNIYITYCIKCGLKNRYFENKKKCKEYLIKELEILKPVSILVFGRHCRDVLFENLGDVQYNNQDKIYKAYGCRIYFTNSPVEMFYDTSLKKPVWKFLKYFKSKL